MKKNIEDVNNKILHYIQGNVRYLTDQYNLLPNHLKEQVRYRASICKESCLQYGKCQRCGCDLPGKLYVTESCNRGEKFPNLMSLDEWEVYKRDNDISL